jgi:hypothetical protein
MGSFGCPLHSGMFIAIAEAERPKIQADRDTEELIHDTSASDSS